MKHYLLAASLLALAAGCGSKKDDAAPTAADPFLGHWQTESIRSVNYDATGKVTSDLTDVVNSQLDVTATTLTFTTTTNGKVSTEVDPYTRNGEVLNVTVQKPNGESYYARNLTASSFTFEFAGPKTTGQRYYVQTAPYHR